MSVEFLRDRADERPGSFALTDHSGQIFFGKPDAWAGFTEAAPAVYDRERPAARERFDRYLEGIAADFAGLLPVGLELDVIHDGRIVIPDGYAARFRPVLGSVHFLATAHRDSSADRIEREYRQQVSWLIESEMIQVLAHPFRVLEQHDVPVSEGLLEWVVTRAMDAGIALEINSHKQLWGLDLRMASECVRAGVGLALATDSHDPTEFGDFSYQLRLLDAVRASGLDPDPLVCGAEELAGMARSKGAEE